MYITEKKFSMQSTNRYNIHMLHQKQKKIKQTFDAKKENVVAP